MYENTTLPNINQFILLINLLKVIMASFISEIKKNGTRVNDVIEQIEKVTKACNGDIENDSYYYLEKGYYIISDTTKEILKDYSYLQILTKFSHGKLIILLPEYPDAKTTKKDLEMKFQNRFPKDFQNIEVKIEPLQKSIKNSGKIVGDDPEKFSTIGMVLEFNEDLNN